MSYYLTIHLCSDATFGGGEGVAGLVDAEIEYDHTTGFPYIGGRTLKGLLVEEWNNLCYALGDQCTKWSISAYRLFGNQGATQSFNNLTTPEDNLAMVAELHIGPAMLPPDLRNALQKQLEKESHQPGYLSPSDILASLTAIRHQTAIDPTTGVAETGSLRAIRVLLRDTTLLSPLHFDSPPSDDMLALLSACLLGIRRGGLGRNRGRGRIHVLLHNQIPESYNDDSFTRTCFERFAKSPNQETRS